MAPSAQRLEIVSCANREYGEIASHAESLRRVCVAGRAKDVATERVTFVSPEAAATLSKDAPVAIEFQPATALRTREHVPPRGVVGRSRSFFGELKRFLAPVGVAHAHGAPFNGTAYFLVFADAYHSARLRVFTNQTTYTPSASEWSALATGPQPIELSVTSATFEENSVLTDGGPFNAGTLSFSVR